jgi:hypothetical protein
VVARTQITNRQKRAAKPATGSDRLCLLDCAAITHHREIQVFHFKATAAVKSRALDHARKNGESLHRLKSDSKQFPKQVNAFSEKEGFDADLDFSRQAAIAFARAFVNWPLLQNKHGTE